MKKCKTSGMQFLKTNLITCGIPKGLRCRLNTCNLFGKIIIEDFPNLEKDVDIQVRETSKTPNRHYQGKISHIIS